MLGTRREGKWMGVPFPFRPDPFCSPAMTSVLEEDVDVQTDGYCSSPRQSGGESAGDLAGNAMPDNKHNVIPAGKKGKKARKRLNKLERKKEAGNE